MAVVYRMKEEWPVGNGRFENLDPRPLVVPLDGRLPESIESIVQRMVNSELSKQRLGIHSVEEDEEEEFKFWEEEDDEDQFDPYYFDDSKFFDDSKRRPVESESSIDDSPSTSDSADLPVDKVSTEVEPSSQ